MAELSLILLLGAVTVILIGGFLLVATMDTGPDWLSITLMMLWWLAGWGALAVGIVLGIIALFQVALR